MQFSFHNKILIKTNENTYTFYNTLLPSLLGELAQFNGYNNYLAVGNGNQKTQQQSEYYLGGYLASTNLVSKQIQDDISKGSLYTTLEFKILRSEINSNFIKEAGLCGSGSNPKIYNYFSFISTETPNGIDISKCEEVAMEVTIYLTISENEQVTLTSGSNKFIGYLLGNGLGDVQLCSGSNYAENSRINRQITANQTKYPCTKNATIENNTLNISITCNLKIGEIDEILFVSDNQVFARKNVKEHKSLVSTESTLTPKSNYVIKINEDIKTISEITKASDNSTETNYFATKFANSFGDEVSLPFNNLFDSSTSRFVSKDARLLFFILNNKVYCYKNENYLITELITREIIEDNISKIISFGSYIFIISTVSPYISSYIVDGNSIKRVANNFASFEKASEFASMQQIDISQANNGKFLFGIITQNNSALTFFANYNSVGGFEVGNYLTNNKSFNYVLAMQKNNFCDARVIYLKEGETSASCRLVTHMPNETETDIYSNLAYELSNNSTRVYTKSRAIISEKNTSPNVVIYYYPQIYQYELPLITNELKNYISSDLNYIIQKKENNQYSIYNLVGYDNPEEFVGNISSLANTEKITDFEFLNDTLLIFLNNSAKKIIAYNLKLNKTQVENVSETNASYLVKYKKYNKLGAGNETVKFSFLSEVNLWFFQIKL